MPAALKYSPQELEDLVLKAAAKCIEESSLLDFTMAGIAKECGLSIGSLYKQVQSKEDVLVALGSRVLHQHHHVFSELMALPLTMPERLMCCLLVSPDKLHSYPFGVHLEMLIGNDALLQRTSARWLDVLARADQLVEDVFQNALDRSYEDGELLVEPEKRDRTISMLNIELWSMYVGFVQVAYQKKSWSMSGVERDLPFPLPLDHEFVESAQRMINSYPWKTPLDDKGIKKVCKMLKKRNYR